MKLICHRRIWKTQKGFNLRSNGHAQHTGIKLIFVSIIEFMILKSGFYARKFKYFSFSKSIFLGRKFKLAFIKIVIFFDENSTFCPSVWSFMVWNLKYVMYGQDSRTFSNKKALKVFLGCLVEQCPQKQAFSLDEKPFKWDF